MNLALNEFSIPQQGIEALAQLSERAIRDFISSRPSPGLASAKRQIVLVRSKLARYKKLFDGNVIGEVEYFNELRNSESELAQALTRIKNPDASLGQGPSVSRLQQDIGDALADVQAARTRRVFISYRRDDSAYIAGSLANYLGERLGPSAVFRDTDSIEPGDDFTKRIDDALSQTRVCLVLIGKRWLGEQADGTTRIHLSDDFVRREVSAALARRITVIPLLIENMRVEQLTDLPSDIAGIRKRNAMPLRPDPDFDHDAARLTSFLIRRLA